MAYFRECVQENDPANVRCYIRGDFNNWEVDSAYQMTKSEDQRVYTLTINQSFRFKVFNQQDNTWMGSECLAENTSVAYETDDHTNIILQAGRYRVTYDLATKTITLEKLS
jgi:hypothetical protein